MAPRAPLERSSFDPGPAGPDEVVVEIAGCGVCHTDVHVRDGYYDLGGGKRITLADRGMALANASPKPRRRGSALLAAIPIEQAIKRRVTEPGEFRAVHHQVVERQQLGAFVGLLVEHVEPASVSTERRQHAAHTVADETAPPQTPPGNGI